MTLWSLVEIVAALATREIPIPELVWLRYLFHLSFMLLVVAPIAGTGFIRTGRPVLQIFRSLLMLVMPLSFMLALPVMSAGQAFAEFWIAPVLVLLMAAAIGERASWLTWAAVVLGWCGAAITYRTALAGLHWSVYPVIMAASFALYVVLTRVLDRTETLLANLFYTAAGVAIALTPVIPFIWQPPSLKVLAVCAAVGLLGWVSLWTLELSLRATSASWISPFMFAQIIAADVMRLVIRGQAGHAVVAGGLIIGFALCLAAVAGANPHDGPQAGTPV